MELQRTRKTIIVAKIAEYETPRIKDYGDLVEVTAGTKPYGNFDSTFPNQDPLAREGLIISFP
jgi:hypothetical protein